MRTFKIKPFEPPLTSKEGVNSIDHRALTMLTPAHNFPCAIWFGYVATAAVHEVLFGVGGDSKTQSFYDDAAKLATEDGISQEHYDAVVAACRNAAARKGF